MNSCCGPAEVPLTRREMLRRAGAGFGAVALAGLLAEDGRAQETPHGRPRAKSVIFLFMGGGPSQVDTFDPKPLLSGLHGKSVPPSIAKDIPRIARAPLENLFGSPYQFRKQGESGIDVSNLFPEVARHVDDLCVIRSMKHDSPIHAPAEYITMTGTGVGDRPSLGAWVSYGLGSENRNLPSFIVFNSDGAGRPPGYHAGFLPARFQGTVCDGPEGIRDLGMPEGVDAADRQGQLELLGRLNELHREPGNTELEARIRSYELAFRMQVSAPEIFDLSGETEETKRAYGMDQKEKEGQEFSRHCLLARRLVERGVRFIQVRTGNWDAHGKLFENHGRKARHTDRAVAALLWDLKRRGLLDETLLVWGGEFGRTPAAQGGLGADAGRDHSPSGFSMWLAGGGVKGGQIIGKTDPVGYSVIERPIHPNDLNATILHALGLDQRRLVYVHHNRQEIPTVLGGEIVREVFG